MSDAHQSTGLPIDIGVRYTHSLGALAPYFDGLAAGRAIASTCPACGRTWFPPRLGCCSRVGPPQWTTLAGTGRIVAGTNGGGTLPFGGGPAGEGLALVALDGADNLALGWVDGLGEVPPEGRGGPARLRHRAGAAPRSGRPVRAGLTHPAPHNATIYRTNMRYQ